MRKGTYKSRVIWLAAAIVWMAFIFCFSHQKAGKSSEISGSLTYRMAEGMNETFHFQWRKETVLKMAKRLEHPIRKAAHMAEYAILAGIFLANAMQYPQWKKRRYLRAFLAAACYAATDEFHQLFIEGRSGELKDVAIDSAGALLGLLFFRIVAVIWSKNKIERGETNGRIRSI